MVPSMRGVRTCVLGAAVMLVACTGRDGGNSAGVPGDAQIHVQTTDGENLTFTLDTSRNQVQVSPPASRVFTASFLNQDPQLVLDVRVDGNRIIQGDRIVYPLSGFTNNDLRVTTTFKGRTWSSDRPNTTGDVYMQLLTVTDNSVDFRGDLQLVMQADNMVRMTLTGFLEVHYGSVEGVGL